MTRRPDRRGFATVVAVFLVGLVTAAVATLVVARSADARRTRAVTADAQLRQLLLAAAADARAHAADDRWSLVLPSDVAGYGVEARVTARSADHVALTAAAGDGHRELSERIDLTRTDGRWRPTSIVLVGK